jgi:aconitate hydratase
MAGSFDTLSTMTVGGTTYHYHSFKKLAQKTGKDLSRLPYSLRVLLENLLRLEDGSVVKKEHIEAVLNWNPKAEPDFELQFTPARVILQDFTGVPCVADLAAMRSALKAMGKDPKKVNPLQPVDLVIDHSVQIDFYGTPQAYAKNVELEFERNGERYEFLKWGQKAFKNFRVVPPATGIVHQVNLEYLAQVAFTREQDGKNWIYPDTCVGTDSHTPMVNGLGILAWGVGGIEAEAAMLGQPSTLLLPQVIGMKLTGQLKPGTTATDLVLTITEKLRKYGVVGKFVEFFGSGVLNLPVANRATIGNMAPEYGPTVGLFPVDQKTTEFLRLTHRAAAAERVEAYYKEQGLWFDTSTPDPQYTDVVELDLSTVEPSLAGPSRPQDRVSLSNVGESFRKTALKTMNQTDEKLLDKGAPLKDVAGVNELKHGAVVISAITSCTNTSNPFVLMAAGLLARNARAKGLETKPWVKTSLAPGSKVATDFLTQAGLMKPLEELRFHVAGYGCTTCIGNSGPLPQHISESIASGQLITASVLSGNRNFEARVHPEVRTNYLASPPLVVAYALAGSVNVDLTKDPIGTGNDGKPVHLKDIWPSDSEVEEFVRKFVTAKGFEKVYADVFSGTDEWKRIKAPESDLYDWNAKSTYIQEPPFFKPEQMEAPKDLVGARVLLSLGDSVTTDHISPAGSFKSKHDAGSYLSGLGVKPEDFNSYGSRRGNHEVMMRGTFANVRIKNFLVPGVEGSVTVYFPNSQQMSVFQASEEYKKAKIPTIVLAGKEYGSGSSRDWAAKGPKLLGVRAVIAESYERIHRSNLVGMGVLPLQYMPGENAASLGLTGTESFDIRGVETLNCGEVITVSAKGDKGEKTFKVKVRIDTPNELAYYRSGGLLPFMLKKLANS